MADTVIKVCIDCTQKFDTYLVGELSRKIVRCHHCQIAHARLIRKKQVRPKAYPDGFGSATCPCGNKFKKNNHTHKYCSDKCRRTGSLIVPVEWSFDFEQYKRDFPPFTVS